LVLDDFTVKEPNDIFNDSLESERALFSAATFEHRTQAIDNLARPLTISGDILKNARTSLKLGGSFDSQRKPARLPIVIAVSG
jgi:hypothetical protein